MPRLMLVQEQPVHGGDCGVAQPQPQCRFINFIDGQIDELSNNIIPQAFPPGRVCGSSHGWITIVSLTGKVMCLNPMTQEQVNLPPVSKFNDIEFDNHNNDYRIVRDGYPQPVDLREIRDVYIKKIILSSSPSNNADFIAVTILNLGSPLAYCKKNDTIWYDIPNTDGFSEDAIFSNGLLYGLHRERLVICNLNGPQPVIVELNDYIWDHIGPPHFEFVNVRYYLVSSSSELNEDRDRDKDKDKSDEKDGLFVVLRVLQDYYEPRTESFCVYKFDVDNNNNVLIENYNLDGEMFFLGLNSSFSIRVNDVQGGVVYYTDDRLVNNHDVARVYSDMGKFDLVDKQVVELLPYFPENENHEPPPCYSHPIWII